MVYELLGILKNTLPEELKALEEAYKNEDWSAIKDIAHKLKGGSSYCGTIRLREATTQLEDAIRANKKSSLITLYKQLITEINAVCEELKSNENI